MRIVAPQIAWTSSHTSGNSFDQVYDKSTFARGLRCLGGQSGGIAILTALGFLLFAIPLITLSLNLAQNSAIDSRVKTNITRQHYCGLAVSEYFDYLLADTGHWDAWLTTNTDGGDPAVYIETRDACGEDIIIQVDQEPVLSLALVDDSLDETLIVPDISAYVPGDPDCLRCQPYRRRFCCFTITVANRTEYVIEIEDIKAFAPDDFAYDCNASADQLTLPGQSRQALTPGHRPHGHFVAGTAIALSNGTSQACPISNLARWSP